MKVKELIFYYAQNGTNLTILEPKLTFLKFYPEMLIRNASNLYLIAGTKQGIKGMVLGFLEISFSKSGKLAYFGAQRQKFSELAHYIFF